MRLLFVLSSILISTITYSQTLEKVMISKEDPYHFYISDGDATDLFYYKMVPKEKPVGVLTIFPSGGESIENLLKQITLHQKAYNNNFLVIIPSYNWGTIRRVPDILFIDSIFQQVVEQHQVSKDNFILCGLSNGGMISLNYGIAAVRDSNTFITPKGIIGIDPPLDLKRFYNYCEREIERNFSEAGVNEAKWLKGVYEQVFGGSPKEASENYIQHSIFSYGEPNGGNAQYLNNIAIRMHSDLNIDYLLNESKRDLYDWNGTDIVAFVNQLKINGNKNANVIITQNKGVRLNGKKHPHSWNIMDADSTIEWMLKLINK
jgi:hypothetical protein